MELMFKQWLELFGQVPEEPVQDPNALNKGAQPAYSLPPNSDLPPTPKSERLRRRLLGKTKIKDMPMPNMPVPI